MSCPRFCIKYAVNQGFTSMCPKAWDLTSLGHHSSVQIGWTLWLSPLLCHIFSKINSILKCQTPFSGDKRSTPSYHPGRECFKINSSAHQDQWQCKTSLWPKIQSLCLHRVKDQYYPRAGPQCSHEMTESSSFMNTGAGLWGLD